MSNPTVLVTGASGTLGQLVLQTLIGEGKTNIVGATRNPEKLKAFADQGVEVRAADFNAPEGLAAAFKGVDRLLLISTDALGTRVAQHRAAIRAAEAAGVQHVLYLSAPAPRPTPEPTLISDHFWTEQALAQSSLDWTFLRDHLYTNLLLMGLPHAIQTGKLITATGTGGRAYVTREDCARAAAAALTGGTKGKTILDITGPAAVTQAELAALATELTGKPVVHIPVDAPGLYAGLTAAGLPAGLAAGLVDFDTDAAQGYHAIVTSAVKDLTGREPTTVREFLTANRAALG